MRNPEPWWRCKPHKVFSDEMWLTLSQNGNKLLPLPSQMNHCVHRAVNLCGSHYDYCFIYRVASGVKVIVTSLEADSQCDRKEADAFRLGHRSPESTTLTRSSPVGSPLMCWLSSNVCIRCKPTSGSPRWLDPVAESWINTWRFLSLQAQHYGTPQINQESLHQARKQAALLPAGAPTL